MTEIFKSRRLMGALAGCAGALAIASATAGPALGADITAQAEPQAITYKQGSVKIEGDVTADPGVVAAGRQVKLYKRGYPYKTSRLVTTTVTDANGHYSFTGLKPDRNSTYRAVVNASNLMARSKPKLVVVYAQGDLDVAVKKNRHIVSKFELLYSPRLTTDLSGRKVRWYFAKDGDARFTIHDRSRSFLDGPGHLKGKSNFKAPRGQYRFRVTYCLDTPDKRDIGVGPPGSPRDCPRSFSAGAGRTLRSVGAAAAPGAQAPVAAGTARG
jgi:hypothetical protein